jgi:hypothetical protein
MPSIVPIMAEPSNPILEYIIVLQIEEIEVLMSFKYQKYQELKTLVELLLSDVHQAHIYDPTWKSLLGEISGFFAREIAVFTDLGSRQQSYQTEISKQIRLLEVDMMFLQSAKQTVTIKSRLENIQQRAETLTKYCQTMLEISISVND